VGPQPAVQEDTRVAKVGWGLVLWFAELLPVISDRSWRPLEVPRRVGRMQKWKIHSLVKLILLGLVLSKIKKQTVGQKKLQILRE